ncbi:helix-turn-helix transcriptional regulator [Lactobacillus johnsonii]|uniref:helix-turn-helix transcriptional regulator n=1 Tax=Lactobacillus johnsonii TaxID=33959 RepID=UPI00069E1070|nr:helix-turn-helix transcriptional regulator [Lactobacillus johnsonii]AYN50129.1 HTH-type transcriptional regulator Xre [Lactobacillus johnsonii]
MNRIKEIRQEKNLSQTDIAKALGVTRQAISLYEKGDREPKLETWQKLADFFGVSVPYLQGVSDIDDPNFYKNLELYLALIAESNSLENYKDKDFVKKLDVSENERIKANFSLVFNLLEMGVMDEIKEELRTLTKKISVSDMQEIHSYLAILCSLAIKAKARDKKAIKWYEEVKKSIDDFSESEWSKD